MRSLISLILLASAFLTVHAQRTCYWPNGDVAEGEVPCSDGEGNTWCCDKAYACSSNKLCIFKALSDEGTLSFGRGSCTDKTFEDDNCPKFCFTKDGFGWGTGSAVTRCSGKDEKYYCAVAGGLDCEKDSRVFTMAAPTILAPAAVTTTVTQTEATAGPTTSAASSSTASSSQTSSQSDSSTTGGGPAPTNTDPEENNSSSDSSKSNATPIGVGVGVGVAVAVVACFGIFMFMRRRAKAKANASPATSHLSAMKPEQAYYPPQTHGYYHQQPHQQPPQSQPVYYAPPQPIHEAASEPTRHEIP